MMSARNVKSARCFETLRDIGHAKRVRLAKDRNGNVIPKEWPPRSIKVVAEVLYEWYRSEYETTAPVSDWYGDAFEVVNAYRQAEGLEPLG